jgi:DnaK suppressor protein
MTAAEIRMYQRRLLSLKKRFGAKLSELEKEALRPLGGEAAGGLSDVPVHPADLAATEYEEEGAIGLLGTETQLLIEVNDALARVEQGTFGRCEECGRAISPARLDILPYARCCLCCARRRQSAAKSPS